MKTLLTITALLLASSAYAEPFCKKDNGRYARCTKGETPVTPTITTLRVKPVTYDKGGIERAVPGLDAKPQPPEVVEWRSLWGIGTPPGFATPK